MGVEYNFFFSVLPVSGFSFFIYLSISDYFALPELDVLIEHNFI